MKLTGEAAGEALRLYIEERMSIRDIADIMGVSHMTVYRMLNRQPLAVLLEA